MGFVNTPALAALVDNTKPVSSIRVTDFDALVVAGGQAPMFNFEGAKSLQSKILEFYGAGKVVAALCHGVALLRFLKTQEGKPFAQGKEVTGFANSEEDAANQAVWQNHSGRATAKLVIEALTR
jgi:putative intracellular protease/amidase